MRPSFGETLDAHNGIGPGFDFARVALAFGVLLWHVPLIALHSYGNAMNTPLWVLNYAILPMFFGLSGFLVAGSGQRLRLKDFALNRALRIFPALIVEISLSAFLLGPIFTIYALDRYFADPQFRSYLLNMVGLIHFKLPGVFLDNPNRAIVNGSLWTVPFEILCYLVMAGLMRSGFIKRGGMLVLVAAGIVVLSMALEAAVRAFPNIYALRLGLSLYVHSGKGPTLLPCFVLGAALYTLRYRIPVDWRLFAASVAIIFAFGCLATPDSFAFTPVALITAPPLIYIVCFVGMLKMPKIPFFWRGDYSYGIYLYGFPIQQALVAATPAMRSWPALLIVGSITVTGFAVFSWHMIEKPILKMRKKFSFVARREEMRKVDAAEAESEHRILPEIAR